MYFYDELRFGSAGNLVHEEGATHNACMPRYHVRLNRILFSVKLGRLVRTLRTVFGMFLYRSNRAIEQENKVRL